MAWWWWVQGSPAVWQPNLSLACAASEAPFQYSHTMCITTILNRDELRCDYQTGQGGILVELS